MFFSFLKIQGAQASQVELDHFKVFCNNLN